MAAAGRGERLGHALPKALVPLSGKALLTHVLLRLGVIVDEIVVAVTPGEEKVFNRLLPFSELPTVHMITGGARRQDSVRLGLAAFHNVDIVAIHDAARPLCPPEVLKRCMDSVSQKMGSCAALPVVDTLVREEKDLLYGGNIDRDGTWAVQTPQCFMLSEILEAHRQAFERDREYTDDASLYIAWGGKVRLVEGSPLSSKLTLPQDLNWLEKVVSL